MKAILVAALVAAVALPVVATARTFTIADESLETRGARRVTLDFTAGELRVVGTDGDHLRFLVEGRCDGFSERCRDRAGNIEPDVEYTADGLRLGLRHDSHFKTRGPHLTVTLEVPRRLAVDVKMAAGDIDIQGLEHDLDVELSAGDVSIDLPEKSVRSVDVRVSVGDASLRHRGGGERGDGWISKRITWDEGPGHSAVNVSLSAGDVNVRLR